MYNQNYQRGPNNTAFNAFQYPNPGLLNVPPPPLQNQNRFTVPALRPLSDNEFIKQWERRIQNRVEPNRKRKSVSISEARKNMQKLISLIESLKTQENNLTEKVNLMSDSEWAECILNSNRNRTEVDQMLSQLNDTYLKELQQSLSIRSAKRARLKKLKLRRAEERKEILRERSERDRKIDENLQKMKDELEKMKQAEEEKLEADVFLREVFRKKHDAKKCISKLMALMKLREARTKSARGRGEHVSETEADTFNKNIEKLISMWKDKLLSYDKEESELRLKLKKTPEEVASKRLEDDTARTIAAWKEAMFGSPSAMPQRDFRGNMAEFIAVRCKWDSFLNDEGTPIPIGWLLPQERRHTHV